MSGFIAALPMYDWPETQGEVDDEWSVLRDRLRGQGIEAPETLVRRNADMPAVPGGIRNAAGRVMAPDPAILPPDELDVATLFRHPRLLIAQTCWGPMEKGLAEHVHLVGQPSYDGIEGGRAEFYASAIVMRKGEGEAMPADGRATIPFDLIRGKRFAFNSLDSMSGLTALKRDLEAAGEGLKIFSDAIATGGHRLSVVAVAGRYADVAAIDCRSWAMAQRFEPAAGELQVVGWTAPRKGLPFITAWGTPAPVAAALVAAVKSSR